MAMIGRAGAGRMLVLIAAGGAMMSVSGCETSQPARTSLNNSSKEYFSEAAYGVKASPRVAASGERVPRRQGRYQLGQPYKVKDTWYRPKVDPDYKKVGAASWYGNAFQGRLTANGEVYDMARLTAAHPTMPLPSYARVTNKETGSSIIVRVNDRGPFEKGRVIDLSKRAAELLDYQSSGVAKVQVDYVGPAPLDTHDDEYLVASYRPGNAAPDPSDGLPTGVMVAMNGSTPTSSANPSTMAFASQPGLHRSANDAPVALPAVGPILPDRPAEAGGLLSYAESGERPVTAAFDSILHASVAEKGYIELGTTASKSEALREQRVLGAYGRVTLEAAAGEGGSTLYSLDLHPDGRYDLDAMLMAAWNAGAHDAFTVRD